MARRPAWSGRSGTHAAACRATMADPDCGDPGSELPSVWPVPTLPLRFHKEEVSTMPKKVRPIPKGYHSVTPALNQADAAQTIEFCKKAFGAKQRMLMSAPGGKIAHAELQIGDSIVML